jgi:eukaryotic-like serine/threonine-protein kinase
MRTVGQETIIGSESVAIPGLPGDLDAFPVYRITTDAAGQEKDRRIIRLEMRGGVASRTVGWRNALDSLDARDRQWLLKRKMGQAKGISERLGQRGIGLLYQWCASGIVIFQAGAVDLSNEGHGPLVNWRLADQVLDHARHEADARAILRGSQEEDARRLVAELSPYPAARQLVSILDAQDGHPYKAHAIEAARDLLASGTLVAGRVSAPWFLVPWLGRGKMTDYVYERQPIDEGGQGTVYRAIHKSTHVPVALKRLRFHDEDSQHRMAREIAAGTRYGSHPSVMPVLEADVDGCWFSMPLANGSAAVHAARLRETGELQDLIRAVCEGLRQPHAEGWIHRDIKPANILFLEGRWVIGDWGLGRRPRGESSGLRRTRTGTGFGTEGFAAPEMSRHPHDSQPTADIYSIGQLIGAILTGRRPEANVPLLPDADPWRSAVAEATRWDSADRPQDVDELLSLLDNL